MYYKIKIKIFMYEKSSYINEEKLKFQFQSELC